MSLAAIEKLINQLEHLEAEAHESGLKNLNYRSANGTNRAMYQHKYICTTAPVLAGKLRSELQAILPKLQEAT